MHYAVQHMSLAIETKAKPARRRSKGTWLLVLPYLGLCFPPLYARATPTLWGFPFFYWYQFSWVIITSALLGIVYYKQKSQ
jgi:hypothetical protein